MDRLGKEGGKVKGSASKEGSTRGSIASDGGDEDFLSNYLNILHENKTADLELRKRESLFKEGIAERGQRLAEDEMQFKRDQLHFDREVFLDKQNAEKRQHTGC